METRSLFLTKSIFNHLGVQKKHIPTNKESNWRLFMEELKVCVCGGVLLISLLAEKDFEAQRHAHTNLQSDDHLDSSPSF